MKEDIRNIKSNDELSKKIEIIRKILKVHKFKKK